MIKIWIDDVRQAPDHTWIWVKSTIAAIDLIEELARGCMEADIDIISLDHDAGDYVEYGGDYIKILDWLEEKDCTPLTLFHIHSMNPVGRMNMKRIIDKNKWRYIEEIE